jgi:integrase
MFTLSRSFFDKMFVTVTYFLERFAYLNPRSLSDSSLRRYRQSFTKFIDSVGDKTHLQDLNSDMAANFVKLNMDMGFSRGTVNLDNRQLKATLGYAPSLTSVNMDPVHFPMVPTNKTIMNAFSLNEIQSLTAAEDNEEFRNFLKFLVWTGVKRNEALDLTWNDVFLDSQDPYIVVTAADRSKRKIVLVPACVDYIGQPKNPTDKVFPLWSSAQVTKRYYKLAEEAKITGHLLNDTTKCVYSWALAYGFEDSQIVFFNEVVKEVYEYIMVQESDPPPVQPGHYGLASKKPRGKNKPKELRFKNKPKGARGKNKPK